MTDEFFREFYELRNKHKIPDAYVIIRMWVQAEDGDCEGEMMAVMHAGSELNRERMVAWALGMEQTERQRRIASASVKRPKSKK